MKKRELFLTTLMIGSFVVTAAQNTFASERDLLDDNIESALLDETPGASTPILSKTLLLIASEAPKRYFKERDLKSISDLEKDKVVQHAKLSTENMAERSTKMDGFNKANRKIELRIDAYTKKLDQLELKKLGSFVDIKSAVEGQRFGISAHNIPELLEKQAQLQTQIDTIRTEILKDEKLLQSAGTRQQTLINKINRSQAEKRAAIEDDFKRKSSPMVKRQSILQSKIFAFGQALFTAELISQIYLEIKTKKSTDLSSLDELADLIVEAQDIIKFEEDRSK
jgi:hypothetical protein